jgi:hypothetical protein
MAKTDFQHWSDFGTALNLGKDWIFTVDSSFRLSDSEDLFHKHVDFGFVYTKLAEWFDVGVNYRFIHKKERGEWGEEHRPHLNLIFKGEMFDIKVKNRFRFEYNEDDEALSDFGTFRYKITLNPEFVDSRDVLPFLSEEKKDFLGSHNARPFASYELFADTETERISRHRFSTGISLKLNDNLVGNVYFMRENNTSFRDRDNLNVLGLSLRILF